MFDARAWLREVSAASQLIKNETQLMSSRRVIVYEGGAVFVGEVVHSSLNPDKMQALDDLIDQEAELGARLHGACSEIHEAVKVFNGMRRVGEAEREAADVLELVHVGLLSQRAAAKKLNTSSSSCNRAYHFGVNWIDAHGLAHAKSGVGGAV